MESVTKMMMDHLKEELEDVKEYKEMSVEAEKMGLHRRAKNLEKIAMEEFTHAKYIRETLIDAGAYVPIEQGEMEKMWNHARMILFHR